MTLLTQRQAAAVLGLSERTVERMRVAGKQLHEHLRAGLQISPALIARLSVAQFPAWLFRPR